MVGAGRQFPGTGKKTAPAGGGLRPCNTLGVPKIGQGVGTTWITRERANRSGSDPRSSYCLLLGTYGEEAHGLSKDSRNSHRRGAAMTDRSYEIPQDADLRNLARLVSACTLGLWAFAAGLLIGVFLFS